ncbi:caspase-8 isoform X2 [Patella vulgata]|nr:caspase-8 isoform X2 [Patella vulgata]XP_050406280.1 caspase-8 isoform X2 [Patella vulgata]XP_055957155.1 caspase-8 isoform X2 [Patella vulgata]
MSCSNQLQTDADSDLHTYRKKLLYIDSDLTNDNIKCLKFLCLDKIPLAKLERIYQGTELFEILSNYNLLGPGNLYFLAQCLNVICRKDLSSYLIDSQILDLDNRRISLYRILLFDISEDMDAEDVTKSIYFFGKIPKSKMTMITTGMDLFAYLEQVKVISPQNLNYLIELLEMLGRGDLKEKVDEYRSKNQDSCNTINESKRPLQKDEVTKMNTEESPPEKQYNSSSSSPSSGDSIIPDPLLIQISYQLQNDKGKIRELGVRFGLEIETINRIFQQHQLRPEMAMLTIFNNWHSSRCKIYSKNEIKDEFIRVFNACGMTELSNKLSEVLHRSLEMEPQQTSSTGTKKQHSAYEVGMKDIHMTSAETHENIPVTTGEASIVEPPAPNDDNHSDTVMRDVEAIQNLSIQQPPQMDIYRMDRKPRGFCIIINNENFKHDHLDVSSRYMKNRQGSSIDKDRLINTFGKLSFIVKCFDDLTAVEMARTINHFALNEDHTNYDCFVVAILSHGTRDNVYGSDGKIVAIRDLTGPLKPLSCPSLCDKPKLFFIQACQGQDRQEGLPLERDAMPEINVDEDTPTRGEVIPNEADFLLGMATIPGFVSYRSKTMGSWYITKLCETFDQYAEHFDILCLLTVVNNVVGQANAELDGGRYKQSPAPFYTLRKRLIFQ